MTEHDPLCMFFRDDEFRVDPSKCEYCRAIGETRADERERIAQAIATREASAAQAYDETREQYWAGAWDAYDYAGQIARGER